MGNFEKQNRCVIMAVTTQTIENPFEKRISMLTHDSKIEYINHVKEIYLRSTKVTKRDILDEVVRNLEINRKSAIRLLNRKGNIKRKPGRKTRYSESTKLHLKKLWRAMNYMCSKKMVAALPEWISYYFDEKFTEENKKELLSISASSIDRILKPLKAQLNRSRNTGTKPWMLMKKQIPIKPLDWKITEPGFVEADTVAHCGNSLSGEFIWSLNFVDVYSQWTETRACWHKSSVEICAAIRDIEATIPFVLKGFSTDNGSEFLNRDLLSYFHPLEKGARVVDFTRGRPYKKNDQCYIEQKNWTHVRELFGYERLEHRVLMHRMNDIYKNEWCLLQNFFVPKMKIKEKTRLGGKLTKKYTFPKTPYQILMESEKLTEAQKVQLKKRKEELNPFVLQRELKMKLHRFRVITQGYKLNNVANKAV